MLGGCWSARACLTTVVSPASDPDLQRGGRTHCKLYGFARAAGVIERYATCCVNRIEGVRAAFYAHRISPVDPQAAGKGVIHHGDVVSPVEDVVLSSARPAPS